MTTREACDVCRSETVGCHLFCGTIDGCNRGRYNREAEVQTHSTMEWSDDLPTIRPRYDKEAEIYKLKRKI